MPLCLFWVLCCIKPSGPPATAHCDHAGLQAHGPTTSALPRWLLSIFQPFQLPSTFRSVSRWVLKTTLKKIKNNNQAEVPPKPTRCHGKGCRRDVHGTSPPLGPCWVHLHPRPHPHPRPLPRLEAWLTAGKTWLR